MCTKHCLVTFWNDLDKCYVASSECVLVCVCVGILVTCNVPCVVFTHRTVFQQLEFCLHYTDDPLLINKNTQCSQKCVCESMCVCVWQRGAWDWKTFVYLHYTCYKFIDWWTVFVYKIEWCVHWMRHTPCAITCRFLLLFERMQPQRQQKNHPKGTSSQGKVSMHTFKNTANTYLWQLLEKLSKNLQKQ